MNQPDKRESSKPKWLWPVVALVALLMLTTIGVGIAAFKLMKTSGIKVLSLGGGAITPIDLTGFYDKSGSWNSGREWQDAPRGPVVLGGVPFEANGLLHLNGKAGKSDGKTYREIVKGIPVGKKFARLHVLHIASCTT